MKKAAILILATLLLVLAVPVVLSAQNEGYTQKITVKN